MESVLVQNTRYDIRSTIAIGGYSIVYRNMANKSNMKYSYLTHHLEPLSTNIHFLLVFFVWPGL